MYLCKIKAELACLVESCQEHEVQKSIKGNIQMCCLTTVRVHGASHDSEKNGFHTFYRTKLCHRSGQRKFVNDWRKSIHQTVSNECQSENFFSY